MLNSMVASVCRDFIGAVGVVLLLFSGVILGGLTEATDYVTCATDGDKLCTSTTSGQACATGKTCQGTNAGCLCR